MTVLHVLPFPGVGGTEIATRRIMDAVAKFGIQNRALLLHPSELIRSYFEKAGIPVHTLRKVPDPSFRRGGRFLMDSWAVAREVRATGAQLVHCADILAAYHTVVACRMSGTPILCHVRNRYSEVSSRDRFFINGASHFAFVSRHTQSHFAIPVAKTKSSVLYDGIDVATEEELASREQVKQEVHQELALPAEMPIVAMFARVAPQKDYETLVRAAGILRSRNIKMLFVMVGDYAGSPDQRTHYERIQQLITKEDVEGYFLFLGFRSDTRRLMLAADICLLCTNWEGLPLVLLESMAMGRPVVATAVDGVPEVIEDGATGWLTPHADAEALAKRVQQLLIDPKSADTMGLAGREFVRKNFSRERFANNIYGLYTRLVPR